jgi:hypothetical protein
VWGDAGGVSEIDHGIAPGPAIVRCDVRTLCLHFFGNQAAHASSHAGDTELHGGIRRQTKAKMKPPTKMKRRSHGGMTAPLWHLPPARGDAPQLGDRVCMGRVTPFDNCQYCISHNRVYCDCVTPNCNSLLQARQSDEPLSRLMLHQRIQAKAGDWQARTPPLR